MHPVFSQQLIQAYMDEVDRQVARASFRASRPPRWRAFVGRRLVRTGSRLMGAPTPQIEAPLRRAA